ncbi:MAG: MarR family transcriptional regulator [Parafilimonas terrae]|nr:MarR family transcriptional regulator [Parafilimonas terrae]
MNPALGFLLHDVARLLRKRFEQRTRDLGLTRAQWQVLVYLNQRQGIHQGGLAELLEMEPITLVRIVDKLEARGLLERRRHPTDRRLWLLHLTEAAHPILETLRGFGDLTRAEALAGIGEDDQERLFQILSGMKGNLLAACARPVETREAKVG